MAKGKRVRKLTESTQLRREIKLLEALQRRGGITLVMVEDQLITAYPNDRRIFR